jgi:hypothetical protein
MRELLYHPLFRLVIGLAALFLGLFFFGVIGKFDMPIGASRIFLGLIFVVYGMFNLAFGVYRLAKKKT